MVVELFPIFSVRTHLSRSTGIMEVLLVSEKYYCRAMRGLSIYYPLCLIVGIRVVSGGCVYVAVLLLIPPVVIFLFSQKSVVETMAHSGLKG